MPDRQTNNNTSANPDLESAAAKLERAHDELPTRPGEDEEDEPEGEPPGRAEAQRVLFFDDEEQCRVSTEIQHEVSSSTAFGPSDLWCNCST